MALLGAAKITSLTENSANARKCNAVFLRRKRATLRAHPWNFAIRRVQIAADATPPAFGRANSFPLPSKCLRALPPDPGSNSPWRDWSIENNKIFTNDSAPLDLRYIDEDAALTDPLYDAYLAADIAEFLCEDITQSNTKKADATAAKKAAMFEARRTNAIEKSPSPPPDDTWLAVRNS